METPCNRDRKDQRGFTMLECVMAVLVVNLIIAGMLSLFRGQEKQLLYVEERLGLEGTWYVQPHPDSLARRLGHPARLRVEPELEWAAPRVPAFALDVHDVLREANEPSLEVVFEQRLLRGGGP